MWDRLLWKARLKAVEMSIKGDVFRDNLLALLETRVFRNASSFVYTFKQYVNNKLCAFLTVQLTRTEAGTILVCSHLSANRL